VSEQQQTNIHFGSLTDHLRACDPGENLARSLASAAADDELRTLFGKNGASGTINLLESAGPISDAYILSTAPMSLITGPGGSAKTTSSVKKALLETARIYPGPDGVRRYVLGIWRQKYDNLWSATIPSWWKILPQDLAGSKWTGAKPRAAEHVIDFEDAWGQCRLIARFRAFNENMDLDDLLGNEQTDAYLNEQTTLLEHLAIALVDRVGRDPPRQVIRRPGRLFGDANAPDVLNYCYRDFYEGTGSGGPGIWRSADGVRVLFRQPGGLDPGAENIRVMGREYYENSARVNAHRPWWVKRMVHARPGFTRDNDPVYDAWDDERNLSRGPIEPTRMLPIVVGIDNKNIPAAVYTQVVGRQARIFAEIAFERASMKELAEAMLELEARLFMGRAGFKQDCEFADFCDPAMGAGEDLGDQSDRARLSEYLGRTVTCAETNDVGRRTGAVKEYLGRTLDGGRPGLLLDPRCLALRRGFNQTYHWKRTRGSNDLASIEKTPDSHPHDALQYAALAWGSDAATTRHSEQRRIREKRRAEGREAGRYNPLRRAHG
jgi:hypothetical protein